MLESLLLERLVGVIEAAGNSCKRVLTIDSTCRKTTTNTSCKALTSQCGSRKTDCNEHTFPETKEKAEAEEP